MVRPWNINKPSINKPIENVNKMLKFCSLMKHIVQFNYQILT